MKLQDTRTGLENHTTAVEFPPLPHISTESWLKPHPDFRLQKLLVPIDFSPPSEKALQYALSIAKEFHGEIILAHVVQPYPALPDLPSSANELTDALIKEGNLQLAKWKECIKDAPCSAKVLLGSTAPAIVEFAKTEGVDLIVLGTHGRTGIAHAFLGSVAERVVRLASCPTLVVRAHERDFIVVNADDPEANRKGGKQLRPRK